MATEREYKLPNGVRLNYVDSASAAQNLYNLIRLFRRGHAEPLFVGDGARPEVVMIPFDQWIHLIDLADEVAADDRINEIVRERLRDDRPEDNVSYEEFMERMSQPPEADDRE